MKQLILPKDFNGEEVFTLPHKESHYLLNVQRKEVGFNFKLLDINGVTYSGTIIGIDNGFAVIRLEKEGNASSNVNSIYLFQCIPKGKKIDLMIRQAVETGVTKFFPIVSDHSVPSFKSEADKSKKRDRWEKIVKEASQQSGTNQITTIEPLMDMHGALDSIKESYTGLFFHQVPLENKPLHQSLEKTENIIIMVIGPEGGLSDREVDLLKKYNFTPSLLGDNILRAETATTFSLGAVKMILLERNSWKKA